jgi:hypothetical protein
MSNVIVAKSGINYKMKVEHMVTQLLTHITDWRCTYFALENFLNVVTMWRLLYVEQWPWGLVIARWFYHNHIRISSSAITKCHHWEWPIDDGIRRTNPTQITIEENNPMLAWFLLLLISKTHVIWENIEIVKNLRICSHNNIQMFIEVVPWIRFHERVSGKCLFIFHWTWHLYCCNFCQFEKLQERML